MRSKRQALNGQCRGILSGIVTRTTGQNNFKLCAQVSLLTEFYVLCLALMETPYFRMRLFDGTLSKDPHMPLFPERHSNHFKLYTAEHSRI